MPSLPEIARYFTGAARLMRGHRDGLDRLDLSADGFWRSFAALVVALPPTMLSWLEFERVERAGLHAGRSEMATYSAHALADLTAWLLPILVMTVAARRLGLSKKIVAFVVATNWGGALLTWLFAPYFLLLMAVGPSEAMQLVGLLISIASIVLTVRLIAAATAIDIPLSIAITTMMVMATLLSYAAVSDLFQVPLA
ncbi:hypothetical protein [Aureimonas pseudogalii]|uniref:Transporter n=1 Tax=Aureimonas pseudogalii TaxID=1744844 RepID=A0A7W6E832_9HYPH|nr:hypothetical protein [Aureimonas pseudogalii]MBB3996471.1 hypothetical protein [Aureimonas pseudogalii]